MAGRRRNGREFCVGDRDRAPEDLGGIALHPHHELRLAAPLQCLVTPVAFEPPIEAYRTRVQWCGPAVKPSKAVGLRPKETAALDLLIAEKYPLHAVCGCTEPS